MGLELICPGLVLLLFQICPPTSRFQPGISVCSPQMRPVSPQHYRTFTQITASTPVHGFELQAQSPSDHVQFSFKLISGLNPRSLVLYCSTFSLLPEFCLPLQPSPRLLNLSASSQFDGQRSYCVFNNTSRPCLDKQLHLCYVPCSLFTVPNKTLFQQELVQTLLSLPISHPMHRCWRRIDGIRGEGPL